MQTVPDTQLKIYVGGAGVARGYLNRARVDVRKSVKDPSAIIAALRCIERRSVVISQTAICFIWGGSMSRSRSSAPHEPNEIVTVLDRHPQVKGSR
jgi:hypothetical protein